MNKLTRTFVNVTAAFAVSLFSTSITFAQDAPAIKPTTCGAPGVGRLVGRADPVAKSASEAADSYVAEDGYWHTPCPLVATPNTQCGSPGVGYSDVTHGMLARDNPNAAAGWRVDDAGKWVECNRPCPPVQPEAFRTWSQGDAVCTTYHRYDSDGRSPARDRVLLHGQLGRWEQWLGAKRGVLHERCENGVRTQTLSTCAPATECDTKITATRNGKAYSYDARPESSRVPNGTSINLTAEDSSTWPATCTAGSWNVPNVLPKPAKPAASAPDLKFCRAQTRQYTVEGLGKRWVAVKSLRTPIGETTPGDVVNTYRKLQMLCGSDGQFTIVLPAASAESGAEEWKRLYELQTQK